MEQTSPESFFIGWDVGSWHCENNRKSRDALVILDSKSTVIGQSKRLNLREVIVNSGNTRTWLAELFRLCGVPSPREAAQITLAIDTPLGFSEAFVNLLTNYQASDPADKWCKNHYLFRYTERHLFEHDCQPLSAVKDMIGSQATKGIHVLAKFAPHIESCGVWTDKTGLRVIETYPSPCRGHQLIADCGAGLSGLLHDDVKDAHTCARIAYLFATNHGAFEPPPTAVPHREGWIWLPK